MNTDSLEDRVFKAISPRLARGLGRDLFRHIEDKLEENWSTLSRRLPTLRMRYKSRRDARPVYDRAKAALRNCTQGYSEIVSGNVACASSMMYATSYREWNIGDKEPIIEARFVKVAMNNLQLQASGFPVGSISHHAVDRMFERMGTTIMKDVISELTSSSDTMVKLSAGAALFKSMNEVKQLAIPTTNGALLCIRSPEDGLFHARSYVLRDTNPRIDYSMDTIRSWVQSKSASHEQALQNIRDLVDRPVNYWWRTQYRPFVCAL